MFVYNNDRRKHNVDVINPKSHNINDIHTLKRNKNHFPDDLKLVFCYFRMC